MPFTVMIPVNFMTFCSFASISAASGERADGDGENGGKPRFSKRGLLLQAPVLEPSEAGLPGLPKSPTATEQKHLGLNVLHQTIVNFRSGLLGRLRRKTEPYKTLYQLSYSTKTYAVWVVTQVYSEDSRNPYSNHAECDLS